jgi:tRNA 2-selenouridine synthase
MNQELTLGEFLQAPGIIFDVRSPAEYKQGHIPGALNLPLFTDEERAKVGTAYKKQGRNIAIELGLQYVGPKMASLVREAQKHLQQRVCRVHCWRGGLRSYSLSWFLNLLQINTFTLKGGYKSFRRKTLKDFDELTNKNYQLVVIGGLTGSGKTEILKVLKEKGEQVVDLEHLACHRGSSFGHIGMPEQPSNEQFENEIATLLEAMNPKKTIWIEDESRLIGSCQIPNNLVQLIRKSPAIIIEPPLEERVQRICSQYNSPEKNLWTSSTVRITKKLGGARTQSILKLIELQNFANAVEELLHYYDAVYNHSLRKRTGPIHVIKKEKYSIEEWVNTILDISKAQIYRS